MEYKPLEPMPSFDPEIIEVDEGVVSRMNPADQLMHTSYTNIRKDQSVRRQQIRWVRDQLEKSYLLILELHNQNLALKKDLEDLRQEKEKAKHKILFLPYKIIEWVLVTGAAIYLAKLIGP